MREPTQDSVNETAFDVMADRDAIEAIERWEADGGRTTGLRGVPMPGRADASDSRPALSLGDPAAQPSSERACALRVIDRK